MISFNDFEDSSTGGSFPIQRSQKKAEEPVPRPEEEASLSALFQEKNDGFSDGGLQGGQGNRKFFILKEITRGDGMELVTRHGHIYLRENLHRSRMNKMISEGSEIVVFFMSVEEKRFLGYGLVTAPERSIEELEIPDKDATKAYYKIQVHRM
jgi:hypothetical protein